MDESRDYSFCRGQMAPDEHILWTGKPEKGNIFTGQNIGTFLFGIPFTAFAVFWTVSVVRNAPGPFFLFGIPFLAIGLYMLFGNFIYTAYMRKRTAYVITNKRIYRRMGQKTDNLSASAMPMYETIIHRNGNGTIRFPMMHDPYYGSRRVNGRLVTRYFSIENVADFDRVQQAIAHMDTMQ